MATIEVLATLVVVFLGLLVYKLLIRSRWFTRFVSEIVEPPPAARRSSLVFAPTKSTPGRPPAPPICKRWRSPRPQKPSGRKSPNRASSASPVRKARNAKTSLRVFATLYVSLVLDAPIPSFLLELHQCPCLFPQR